MIPSANPVRVALLLCGIAVAASVTLILSGHEVDRASAGVPIVVTNLDDPGNGICNAFCTLREAIDAANSSPGAEIHFNIAGCPPSCTIQPGSGLPTITANSITIDGTSEPDFAGVPLIEINGGIAGAASGLHITGNDVTIRGLVINGFEQRGIFLSGANAEIKGNYIGTDAAGAADAGNAGDGILINNVANDTIGGTSLSDRNIISGNNGHGVNISGASATGNVILGNYIGTDVTGDLDVGNGGGIGSFDGNGVNLAGPGNTIGGITPGSRNVISGSDDLGIFVVNGGFENNVIQGNHIGTNAAGTDAIPNAGGVHVASSDTTVGGNSANARNVISGNQFGGVRLDSGSTGSVVQGNYIGTGADGTSDVGNGSAGVDFTIGSSDNLIGGTFSGEGNVIAFNSKGVGVHSETSTGNQILGNSIHSNSGMGIDLITADFDFGVSPNDAGDADGGGNNQQNFPELTSALAGSVTVEGTLNSTGSTSYLIEVFANDACDDSEHGEGQTPLGKVLLNTDPAGDGQFMFQSSETVAPGSSITATATNLTTFDTSEFSQCIDLTTPTPTPTQEPTPTPTGTPSPTPSPTPTPTATPPTGRIQGDVNCDGNVTSVDSLGILRYVAGLPPLAQTEPCPDIGAGAGGVFGDVDCKNAVISVDSLGILRFVALLSPLAQQEPCTDIGDIPATGT